MSDIAVALVAAVARNGVIGADGAMPWRLSTDLRRFKTLTVGHPVVMGRKTFDSIGGPLPGRANIVVTRDAARRPAGVTVASSLPEAIEAAKAAARDGGKDIVFVIGGGEIYRAAMPLADVLHVTHVEADPAGDAHFPVIDPDTWIATSEEHVPAGEKDTAATTYAVYRRRQAVASG